MNTYIVKVSHGRGISQEFPVHANSEAEAKQQLLDSNKDRFPWNAVLTVLRMPDDLVRAAVSL